MLDEKNQLLIYCILLFAIIAVLIKTTQLDLTPKLYIINSFLYITLAMLIFFSIIMMLHKYVSSTNYTIASFLALIILIPSYNSITKNNKTLQHIVWLCILVNMAIITCPQISNIDNVWKIAITVSLLVGMLIFVTYKYPTGYFSPLGKYLFFASFSLVLYGFVLPFITSNNYWDDINYSIFNYLGIAAFSIYIVYDSDKIRVNAKNIMHLCKQQAMQNKNKNKNKYSFDCSDLPDYSAESLNLFIGISNFFIKFIKISRN